MPGIALPRRKCTGTAQTWELVVDIITGISCLLTFYGQTKVGLLLAAVYTVVCVLLRMLALYLGQGLPLSKRFQQELLHSANVVFWLALVANICGALWANRFAAAAALSSASANLFLVSFVERTRSRLDGG